MNENIETNVEKLRPFTRFLITIGELPTSYLMSMTYYEQIIWFTKYLQEKVIPAINNNATAVEELQHYYIELKNYVETYFENLDVQEEINNKLDEMADSGELTDIIAQYLGLAGMITFNNVAEMKTAENLVNGSKCQTLGFYSVNDKGNAIYKIRNITNEDVVDEKFIIALYNENLVAELIFNDELNIMQLGYTDDISDTFIAYNKGINTLLIPDGNYHLKSGEYSNINLKGYNNSTLIIDDVVTFNKLSLENINIDGENISQMFLPLGNNVDITIKNCNVDSEVNYFIYADGFHETTFNDIIIENSNFKNLGVSPFRLIGQGNTIKMYNNTFKNIGTSNSTRTSGLQAGVLSVDEESSYFNKIWVENNEFYNLTSANSTGSDSSECQAIKIRSYESFINNNKIEKINGTGEDHEGIYVKGEKSTITNNILIDCGAGDGAITCKPVTNLICSNNIINTTGNGLLIRSVQGLVDGNIVNVKNGVSTDYLVGRFGSNESTNLVIQNNSFHTSDNSNVAFIFDYVGCTFKNNTINAENVAKIITLSNAINGKLKIIDNIFNLESCKLFRVSNITTNFELLFENNIFNLKSCSNISEIGSGTNAINLKYINNQFNLTNNETTDYLFRSDNLNVNSNIEFTDNRFNLGTSIDTLILVNGNSFKFINNKILNNSLTYLVRTGTDKSLIDIENNNFSSTGIIRFVSPINITDFKFINNFIFENTNIFTTNTATITNAYLINNTFKSGTITDNLSITNTKNYGNASYN